MNDTPKSNHPALRPINDTELTRESWKIFQIMAEFVEGFERLASIRPSVSIFGSARFGPDHPYYQLAEEIGRALSDSGFSVVTGAGPGIMEAANRGANGASLTLQALADSLQSQLSSRRVIEIERAKPYVVVRQVTVISLITLVGVYLLSPSFFEPYRTPLGQLILAVLLTLYLGSLILMRRKAQQHARPRILLEAAR